MANPSFDDIRAILKDVAAMQKANEATQKANEAKQIEHEAKQREHEAKQREHEIKQKASEAKSEAEYQKVLATIASVGKQLGSISSNLGSVTEEFFYNSLNANPTFGGIKFDRVTPNLIVGTKKRQSEFDIVLTNGNSIAIVEIKHKAHVNDLDQVEAQIKRYRELCPEYINFDIYGGIAGFSVPPDVVKAAHERGLFVLKRKGEILTADAKGMRAF